jgi:hypothetical protein
LYIKLPSANGGQCEIWREPQAGSRANQGFELQARKELEQSRKNAAYSVHGGTSSVEICRFGKTTQAQLTEIPPFFQKPNLAKLGLKPGATSSGGQGPCSPSRGIFAALVEL